MTKMIKVSDTTTDRDGKWRKLRPWGWECGAEQTSDFAFKILSWKRDIQRKGVLPSVDYVTWS
jgi:hypothetical protein